MMPFATVVIAREHGPGEMLTDAIDGLNARSMAPLRPFVDGFVRPKFLRQLLVGQVRSYGECSDGTRP